MRGLTAETQKGKGRKDSAFVFAAFAFLRLRLKQGFSQ
jgi:hypothetical protein